MNKSTLIIIFKKIFKLCSLKKILIPLLLILLINCDKNPIQTEADPYLLSAQEKVKGLIFSEVYLDENQPSKSWIEVWNPTDKPLILATFRISHIKTGNILPPDIQRNGGILVNRDEYLVLCVSEAQFNSEWGNIKNLVAVNALSYFSFFSGFIALTTEGLEDVSFDTFRYGVPEMSEEFEDLCGSQVIPFSKNGKSYSRNMLQTEEGIDISDFHETAPTPGIINEIINLN